MALPPTEILASKNPPRLPRYMALPPTEILASKNPPRLPRYMALPHSEPPLPKSLFKKTLCNYLLHVILPPAEQSQPFADKNNKHPV